MLDPSCLAAHMGRMQRGAAGGDAMHGDRRSGLRRQAAPPRPWLCPTCPPYPALPAPAHPPPGQVHAGHLAPPCPACPPHCTNSATATPTPQAKSTLPRCIHSPNQLLSHHITHHQAKSTLDIVRSLLVFRACQIGPLVANADAVLAWSKRVFGPRLTNWGIRHSFYKQFVAGEVAAGSVCLRSRLAARACAPAGTPTGAGPDRRRCAPAACVPPARWPATPSRTWLPALPTPPLCGRVC